MTLITPADIEIAIRLVVAAFLGGLIGLEREHHGKEAGFRTHALVCLGSALMMVVSLQIFELYKDSGTNIDPARIAAQVVSGIGFLGAGAIIRYPQSSRGGIKGLTTAAGIWAAAGIGLASGLGQYRPAILTTILTLVILIIFPLINPIFGGRD